MRLASKTRRSLRLALLSIASAGVVGLPGRLPARAQPAAPTTAPASTRLFADDKLVTLPRVSVEVVGTGPDLVLIPGLACSREVWRHTVDRLRDKYTLHVLQVAGFAGEPAGENATGPVVDPVVEAIDGYLQSAKLAPAVVVGHSLGGTMALRLAQQHPADVKKIMMVDALPFYGVLIGGPAATVDTVKPVAEAMRKQVAAAATPAARETATKAMIGRMVTAPADVDRAVGWSLASDHAVVGQAAYDDLQLDMRPGLAGMTTPVTLVYPFDAKMGVPEARWDEVYHAAFEPVPHRTLARVDGSCHFVMYDQPDKFDAAVDAFLKD